MNPFAAPAQAFAPDQTPVGGLPVMSAPGVDVAATKLQEIEQRAMDAKVGPGISAAPVQAAVTAADGVTAAFDKADKRTQALEFEKLLAGGWTQAKDAWVAAGSPPEANPDNFATGDPQKDGGPEGNLVNFYKALTGYKDTEEVQKGRAAAQGAAAGGGTEAEVAAKFSPKDAGLTPENILNTVKDAAARSSKEDIAKWHNKVLADNADKMVEAKKDVAKIREQIRSTSDAGILAGLQAKLDDLTEARTTRDAAFRALDRTDILSYPTQLKAYLDADADYQRIQNAASDLPTKLKTPAGAKKAQDLLDANKPAPAVPAPTATGYTGKEQTATNKAGDKVYWNGTAWLPVPK